MSNLRHLPSIDRLLQSPSSEELIAVFGRPLTLSAIRETINEIRDTYTPESTIPSEDVILESVQATLNDWTSPSLSPVINATGVILHTNLGRAPMSEAAIQATREVAENYSNLEFDLTKGRRGSRLLHAESLLHRLTGAEAALIVNNNAAAVMLILTALARRRKVVIARTQLVEIGGGFRIPNVMKQSGAKLLEVGTTNKVHLSDYENALEEKPALFLRAHRSNFKIVGFTSEPTLSEIASVARQSNIPLIDDLGSGSLIDTTQYGLGHEPMIQESLADGADLVCFSGDKLLGGPQAGVIVGKSVLVNKLKKHPLARAIRSDKLCLAAMSATLLHYLKDEAESNIPIWRMISTPIDQIHARALNWLQELSQGQIIDGESTVGGGSLPGETMPTFLLALTVRNPDRFLTRMRMSSPPVIARLENDLALFDPRTVLPELDNDLLSSIKHSLIAHGEYKYK